MNLEAPFERIAIEPGKMEGQPRLRGMRITVRRVPELLKTYQERKELLSEYPDLQPEDLEQALAFTALSTATV